MAEQWISCQIKSRPCSNSVTSENVIKLIPKLQSQVTVPKFLMHRVEYRFLPSHLDLILLSQSERLASTNEPFSESYSRVFQCQIVRPDFPTDNQRTRCHLRTEQCVVVGSDHEDAIIKEISKLCGTGGMAEQWIPCQFKARPCSKFSDQRKCNQIDTKAPIAGHGAHFLTQEAEAISECRRDDYIDNVRQSDTVGVFTGWWHESSQN